MMFNPFPLLFTALLILVPMAFLAKGRRAFLSAAVVSTLILLIIFLRVFVPGIALRIEADRGDADSMYEYARWIENHDQTLRDFIFWPVTPQVLRGYEWLEKAADHEYPPALYAKGVRLKHGDHVPRPADWTGASGNHFPQPERGQPYIDKAIALGYKPAVPEKQFYWQQYRKR